MSPNEFRDWLVYHSRVLPDFRAWLSRLRQDAPDDHAELMRAWAAALSDVDMRDARAVTSRMVAGDDDIPAAYERERTAAIVRRLAKANYVRRTAGLARRVDPETLPQRGGILPGGLLRQINAAVAAGEDFRAAAKRIIPPTPDDGPRYSCWLCGDSGLVTVWHERSIRAVMAGGDLDPLELRTCAAPCSCAAGRAKLGDGDRHSWPERCGYSEDRYCLCRRGDVMDPREQAELRNWVAARQHKALESHPSYSPQLAAWSATASTP